MRVEFGNTKSGFTTLPMIMFAIYRRPEPYLDKFCKRGQLYRGYWGLYAFWHSWHIDFWYHHWEA